MATNSDGPRAPRVGSRRSSPTSARAGSGRAATPLSAFVLHRYDWSESSLIVELFTRGQGRVVVVAKGAKRPTSNFRAVLLPFVPINVLLGRTPAGDDGEIHPLRNAEWAGGAALLGAGELLAGFYCNELLLKLLARHDPHPVLFDGYAQTLEALAVGDAAAVDATLRAFELLLLRQLGWLPDLAQATPTAAPLQAEARYTLHPEAGLVPQPDGLAGTHWAALEAALARPPGGAALRSACAPVAAGLRAPLRALLQYHLGDSALRTRQVWQGVQRLARSERWSRAA